MIPTLVMLPPQRPVTRQWAEQLRRDLPGLSVQVAEDEDEARQLLPHATAAYGTLSPGLLTCAPGLSWLQAPSAAPQAAYYFPELIAHPVQVTDFRGILNDHVATHALSLVLAFARGLHRYGARQRQGEWKRDTDTSAVIDLPTTTALVVGVGGIGGEVARLMNAFGARVIGVDANRTDPVPGVAEMHGPGDLDRLLPLANVVIVTLPHTPQTVNLFDARRLNLLREGSLFVNVGRGATVDLDAIVAGLQSGRLAGVGLDVYQREPLAADHPLWHQPNAILTPHVAGIGPHLDERKYPILRENARRHIEGLPLLNVANKEQWY
jgi:phosphoglycerate dehydrogenase-like enzyme